MQVIVEIIFGFISHLVELKEKKAGKIFWGYRLIFLGVVLTSFAIFLFILSMFYGGIKLETWAATGPFLIVGVPSLVIGIILVNNP